MFFFFDHPRRTENLWITDHDLQIWFYDKTRVKTTQNKTEVLCPTRFYSDFIQNREPGLEWQVSLSPTVTMKTQPKFIFIISAKVRSSCCYESVSLPPFPETWKTAYRDILLHPLFCSHFANSCSFWLWINSSVGLNSL